MTSVCSLEWRLTSDRTGRILYVMGQIIVAQGKPDEGLEFFLEALENLKVALGDGDWQTADCCYLLAFQLIRVGRLDEAR